MLYYIAHCTIYCKLCSIKLIPIARLKNCIIYKNVFRNLYFMCYICICICVTLNSWFIWNCISALKGNLWKLQFVSFSYFCCYFKCSIYVDICVLFNSMWYYKIFLLYKYTYIYRNVDKNKNNKIYITNYYTYIKVIYNMEVRR